MERSSCLSLVPRLNPPRTAEGGNPLQAAVWRSTLAERSLSTDSAGRKLWPVDRHGGLRRGRPRPDEKSSDFAGSARPTSCRRATAGGPVTGCAARRAVFHPQSSAEDPGRAPRRRPSTVRDTAGRCGSSASIGMIRRAHPFERPRHDVGPAHGHVERKAAARVRRSPAGSPVPDARPRSCASDRA